MVDRASAWFALQVKPRFEFIVQNDLSRNGTEVFLPAVNRLSQWKDRKKRIEFPLFPGYLFSRVFPVADCFLELLKTRGVVRILAAVPGHPTPVPDKEIAALKVLLATGSELDLRPELQAGKVVRINKGIFQGVQGFITRRAPHFLLHVNISLMGRCVTVKIPPDDVELV